MGAVYALAVLVLDARVRDMLRDLALSLRKKVATQVPAAS